MIQRIQSIYLLLATLVAIVTVWKPELTNWDKSNLYMMINDWSAVAVAAVSLFSIFLFKNRKMQIKFSYFNLLLASVAIFSLVILFINSGGKYSFEPFALLHLIIIISIVLAISGIKKDEKLIRSLDRLR